VVAAISPTRAVRRVDRRVELGLGEIGDQRAFVAFGSDLQSFSDERELGEAVGQLLVYGEPFLPDDRGEDGDQRPVEEGNQRGQLLALFEEWMRR